MERIHEEFNAMFERHRVAIDRLGKEFDGFCKDQEMIDHGFKSAQFAKILVEVPVEMSVRIRGKCTCSCLCMHACVC